MLSPSKLSVSESVPSRRPSAVPSMRALDLDAARRYLAGVESMAREASTSQDPRVVVTALQVIAHQSITIAEMGVLP
jgi:hypothetical protein